jgi:hypothetical protein
MDRSMTKKEYEQQFSDALAELRSRKFQVASPYTAPDGVRRVQIDGASYVDKAVFEKAWGHEIAEKITRQYPPD